MRGMEWEGRGLDERSSYMHLYLCMCSLNSLHRFTVLNLSLYRCKLPNYNDKTIQRKKLDFLFNDKQYNDKTTELNFSSYRCIVF